MSARIGKQGIHLAARYVDRMSLSIENNSELRHFHFVIVPGWQGSGPDHWQTHWQQQLPSASRVQVANWDYPDRDDWVQSLDRALQAIDKPVVLIAHSLGCPTVAHWAGLATPFSHKVVGALLVAPADVERSTALEVLRHFGPIPQAPLPFKSLLLSSENDHAASAERAAAMADWWGAELQNLGEVGHINPAAGFHQWLEGLSWLKLLIRRC